MGAIGDVKGGAVELGYSPRVLKNLAGTPLVPPEATDPSGMYLRAVGIERVLLPTQVWQSAQFNVSQPMQTPNNPVLSGIFYGFRIEPFSLDTNDPPFFQCPRTIITRGLSKADGGDGVTKIWPVATRGWYPHAFASLQFGVEANGSTATDGPWEVWGALTPEAMLISLGELLTTGYVRDGVSGLYTSPDGVSAIRPILIQNTTAAPPVSMNPQTLTKPYDSIFGFLNVTTTGAVATGVEVDFTWGGGPTIKLFGPAIGSAGTFSYTLSWGPGKLPSATYTMPGTPPPAANITVPVQAGVTNVQLVTYKDY